MIKGCQKKIIHIKNTNSPYFEEAYFILKNDGAKAADETDMIREAEKIAAGALAHDNGRKKGMDSKRATVLLLSISVLSFILAAVMLIVCICA